MFQKLLAHPIFHLSVGALVALGVAVTLFPSLILSLSWMVNYAVHIMLFYLVSGILFLFMRQPRLTFICFAGCGLLCLYLKYSIKNNSIERWRETVIQEKKPLETEEEKGSKPFKIAHFNITNANSLSHVAQALKKTNADLLSIHEVTPEWDAWLADSLTSEYPYSHVMVDIGMFGMALYAKYPLEQIDTFYYQEIPNLAGCFSVEGERICFVNIHTEPALNSFSLKRLQEHLDSAANFIDKILPPVIVMGDFNAVPWSSEIRAFTSRAGLQDSRTGFIQFSSEGYSSFFDIPLDHIFFTPHLQCVGFESIKGNHSEHLGICGTYQFKRLNIHAKKTAR
jgi:endonuclease/exonuclease/phosphatase (EEP) superfamily protein YafD